MNKTNGFVQLHQKKNAQPPSFTKKIHLFWEAMQNLSTGTEWEGPWGWNLWRKTESIFSGDLWMTGSNRIQNLEGDE